MKRFTVSLISTILAFTAGLVTASSWTSNDGKETVIVAAKEPCARTLAQPPAPVQSFTVTPPQGFDFGQKGLRLVPERVQLKSENLGYDIDVSYPQIVETPSTNPTNIQKVNQQIRDSATKLYQWSLSAAEAQRRSSQARLGIHDTVNFTYQVGLATDALLSVHFIGYSYDGRPRDQVADSFTLNYDLTSGKQLKLSDLFKPGSKYLEFISPLCIGVLSKGGRLTVNHKALAPAAENFNMWEMTTNGITFNFNACQVMDCEEGDQMVQIPFSELNPMLNPDIPRKFQITYP